MRSIFLFTTICFLTLVSAEENKAAGFTLKNLQGEEVSLSDFSGKIVLLEWYTSWCKKCRAAFPYLKPFLNKTKKEFADKDVVVIAINLDQKEPEKIAEFAKKKGIEYTILTDPEGKETGKNYNLKTLPLLVVIGKDGIIAKKFMGFKKGKTIKAIQKTLVSLTSGEGE